MGVTLVNSFAFALSLAVAPVVAGSAAADVVWETSVRITDKLGRGTAEIEETITTSVSPAGRREEVAGSRRMTTRRGRQYERPGRRVTIDRLDEGVAYDLDLDAGTYTKATFAELARERERTLVEAGSVFRAVPLDAALDRPVAVTRSGERRSVGGIACAPARLEVARGGFTMRLELCLAEDAGWAAEIRATEARLCALTGETDAYLGRLLDVLARRRDLFAIFDDLHYRLERERRKLGGVPVHWVEQMTGPERGAPDVVLFRLEGTVTSRREGPVAPEELAVPPALTLAERRPER